MTEEWGTLDYVWIGGAFLAFLFGPAIVFAISGEYRAAAIGLLSPLGIVMMFEAGFYEKLKRSAFGGEAE